MASGIIPYSSIPGWPSPPAGLFEACEEALVAAGFSASVSRTADGVQVSDVSTVNAVLSDGYVGGATQLSFNKVQKQATLDAAFDQNFDLTKFIRGGTVTTVTAAGVGAFIATITNNYRSLRAQIASAGSLATLNAININSGWPSNP